MPAPFIRPAAAGHRRPFRVHRVRAWQLFAAVMLWLGAAVAAAGAAPSRPALDKNSFYLSSAGFHMRVANDPAGQKALHALPAHRFVASGAGEALRYSYAEPQRCVCIFVGTRQDYDRYLKMLEQPLNPAGRVAANYKTQAGVLLSNQPLRVGTRGDRNTLSDYLSTLTPRY